MAVKGYSKVYNKDTNLTIQQETFIYHVLNGRNLSDSFRAAYPKNAERLKPQSVAKRASTLFANPKVQKVYNKLLEEFRNKEKEKIGWTREQSIEALQFVIDTNRKDLERIEQACEEELTYLQELLDNETDPKLISQTIQTMLKQRKRTRANKTNNDGIISSVSELNKMHGYNEQNINMNGTVIFEGEEDLME